MLIQSLISNLSAAVVLGLTYMASALPGELNSQWINIVEWKAPELPPVHERSAQPPLTGAEVLRLAKENFATADLVKMITERRCACDVSADGLIALKHQGVAQAVLSAMSLHALPPNRRLSLEFKLEFEGDSRTAKNRFLYLIIPDEPVERVFYMDLQEVLAKTWPGEDRYTATDGVLNHPRRRIVFQNSIELKQAGARKVLLFTSARGDIRHSHDLAAAEFKAAQSFPIEYPSHSELAECTAEVSWSQDLVLKGAWDEKRHDFHCEWK